MNVLIKVKNAALLLTAIFLFGMLAGCGQTEIDDEAAEAKPEIVFVNLDYCGGTSNSPSKVVAAYNQPIAPLPLDVEKSDYDFVGWYTQPNCYGIQVCDSNGVVKKTELSDDILRSTKYLNGEITLYAGFVKKRVEVELILNDKKYKTSVEIGEKLGLTSIGNGITALKYSKNQFGGVFDEAIIQPITLYVTSWKKSSNGSVYNVALDQGFSKNTQQNSYHVSIHEWWNMGTVTLNGNATNGGKNEYKLSYTLLQNITNLPHGSASGLHSLWLCDDTYSGKIEGTGINSKIGLGAYNVRIIYKDNSTKEYNRTNFLASKAKNDNIEMCVFEESVNNPIVKIEVVVLYEFAFNYPISYWLGYKEYSNYRCEYTIYP